MLRITVEIVPFGIEEESYRVGTMLIANDGSGTNQFGNYSFAYNADVNPRLVGKGVVREHARSLGFWALIKRVLNATSDETNETTDILVERLKES